MLYSHYQEEFIEAGCDEAGRGCLAGPVFAAAVIFPVGFRHNLINDSKKLPEKLRLTLRNEILKQAISYGIAYVDNNKIDEINILQASILAMHNALKKLIPRPGYVIVDGNRFSTLENIPYKCIVKGDSKYISIAAASILAKTYRDDYMKKLHEEYPQFDWQNNKGYPTEFHRRAIIQHGITVHHRKTFIHPERQLKLQL